ncbi:MAG: Trk family potassium uptake protein, partial [Clostridia bacterium]|nr:Trk family potassium uptake protein [Clostridia bacterium]
MEQVKKAKKRRPFAPTVKIAVGYLLLIAAGAAILLLPFATWENKSIGLTTALFTSTSAVCVTGLTVVDTFTTFSWFGQAVIFVLIQMGGLGFMTMAAIILLLLGKKLSLKDKFSIAESLNTN